MRQPRQDPRTGFLLLNANGQRRVVEREFSGLFCRRRIQHNCLLYCGNVGRCGHHLSGPVTSDHATGQRCQSKRGDHSQDKAQYALFRGDIVSLSGVE